MRFVQALFGVDYQSKCDYEIMRRAKKASETLEKIDTAVVLQPQRDYELSQLLMKLSFVVDIVVYYTSA